MNTTKTSAVMGAALLIEALLVLWVGHQPAFPAKSALFEGFPENLRAYIELREKVKSNLPTLSNRATAAQIAQHRNELAQALRAARPNAKQGDIFTPSVAADFVQVLRTQTAPSAQNAIREGNPATEGTAGRVRMEVNAQYPLDETISIVPPTILLKLPELPKELRYCFVGKNLVLLDGESNLIVDYIPQAAK